MRNPVFKLAPELFTLNFLPETGAARPGSGQVLRPRVRARGFPRDAGGDGHDAGGVRRGRPQTPAS